MGYLVHAYYNISPTRYYKDNSCWGADMKSKTTEDIISIGSFVEVLVLNQYVLVRKILADQLSITKISYRVNSSKEATMRITRGNDPLNLTIYDKFRVKTLGFGEWLEVMAFYVILILSDSLEESVGTSTARVILFDTIPTTIPPTTPTTDLPVIHNDTLLTPTISPSIPTIPPVAPTIQYTSPFINTDSSDRQPNPIGRPYRTQPDRVLKMLTAWKSVESLPTYRLASRYPSDPSSSDTSSDSSLRHSSSGYALSDYPDDSSTAASKGLSRKRCRSLPVPVSLPMYRALSSVQADLSPPPKRIRDFDSATDLENISEDGYEPYVPREVGLGVDVEDSYEPYIEPDINPDILADVDECIAYGDAIRARGIDDRDVVETAAAEEVESSARGMIEAEVDPRVELVVDYDVRKSVREDVSDHVIADGAVEVTYETLGGWVQRFHDHAVENPVHRIQNEQQDDHVEGDVNNGNGNGSRNGNPNVNNGCVVPVVRDCTYQDFVKCQPLNSKGMEGVVGLTRWFKKMETMFHISNCPPRYQVKYATCTLLDNALTWWNSHKRTYESIDSAFARFNTINTSLKALDEGYSSKNYVRKFLRAVHPKWRAKVTAIEVSKDLTSLSLNELIRNLKVYEIIIKKDSKIVKAKVERKYLDLKAKKESSDEECLTSRSEDEEYAMAIRDFKKFFKRRECSKPPKDKNQRAFVRGSWSDSSEEDDEKVQNKTCLVTQASSE
nr:hypothetical protein [Tanacetum cinerariifolium]